MQLYHMKKIHEEDLLYQSKLSRARQLNYGEKCPESSAGIQNLERSSKLIPW